MSDWPLNGELAAELLRESLEEPIQNNGQENGNRARNDAEITTCIPDESSPLMDRRMVCMVQFMLEILYRIP